MHAPVQRKRIGFGLKVINDKLPAQNTLNASLFFTYHLSLGGGKLSAGIEAGMFRRSYDFSQLILTQPADVAIPSGSRSTAMPDLGAGLYYQKKQFYMGLSASHLLPPPADGDAAIFIPPAQHLYFLAGNVFEVGRDWTGPWNHLSC
jgi:type IX secretion system PorP/SprF family membrane protein